MAFQTGRTDAEGALCFMVVVLWRLSEALAVSPLLWVGAGQDLCTRDRFCGVTPISSNPIVP